MRVRLVLALILALPSFSLAATEPPHYIPEVRKHIPRKENFLNFGLVYAAQWAVYLYTQRELIEDHGSFDNWTSYPANVRFDNDSFDYNIFKHTLSGQFYYLFYRSQGNTQKNAFFWTFMSSLAFEFTIETVTENPSWQDIYQTPVFGTVAGIGIERLSRYLHRTNNFFAHGLAYLINPLSLLPVFSKETPVVAMPIVGRRSAGILAVYEF